MNRAIERLKHAGLLAAALFLLVVPSMAQTAPAGDVQPEARSNVVRQNRAPISSEILRVHLPKPVKATLSNGMRVLILEDHRFPLVTVEMSIDGAGSLFDPSENAGLASMTASLMRQGTTSRSSKQLAEEIDKLGANISLNASAGDPEAMVRASGLSDNFDQWFAIMTEVLLHPSFPDDELTQLKQRQMFQLRQQRSASRFLASEEMMKVLYGSHPAAVVSGTRESISSITTEMTSKWYQEHYAPQNTIVAVAGDVKASELIPKLEAAFKTWKKTETKVVIPPAPAAAGAMKIYLVDRPGSVQTNLLLGNLTIDRRNPDYVVLTLLNNIVGGGAAGRLFMNLREDKGYTYGAYSRLETGQFAGPWVANSEVRSEVTGGAVEEFLKEIRRIAEEPVPAEELRRNQRAIVARFALSLERPTSLIGYQLTSEKYGFPADYWDKYASQVMSVKTTDIQRVAQKYLKADAIQIVAVGDAAKIKNALEKYGTVEVIAASPVRRAAARRSSE